MSSMSVSRVIEQRYVTPMLCGRCLHPWNYTGKNPYVATCPFCRTSVSVRKHSVKALQTGPSLATPAQFVETHKPMDDSNGQVINQF